MTRSLRKPAKVPGLSALTGKRIALAGHFAALTQTEAGRVIEAAGGQWVRTPGVGTDYLVVGQEGWPFDESGHLTQNMIVARQLRARGQPLEVITEQQFLELASLAGDEEMGDVRRLYSTAELSRILGVPGPKVRSWVRQGLIVPASTDGRVDYFDFRQVAAVRHIQDLIGRGVAPGTIRHSLERVKAWLPDVDDALAVLSRLQPEHGLHLQLDDGSNAEPSGQLRLPLGREGESADRPGKGADAVAEGRDALRSGQEWLAEGRTLEDAGDLDAAERAYKKALMRGAPEDEAAFRLAHVFVAKGQKAEALERFRQAVDARPQFGEAWNLMAGLLTELERFDEAIAAGETALVHEPENPGAHFNIALALLATGRGFEARRHGRVYLSYDPDSQWADQLRDLLDLDR
jgi:Flp pilus assembly protein TadD